MNTTTIEIRKASIPLTTGGLRDTLRRHVADETWRVTGDSLTIFITCNNDSLMWVVTALHNADLLK